MMTIQKQQFTAIGNHMLDEIAHLEPSRAEYQDGLRMIINLCVTALNASKDVPFGDEDGEPE